MPSPGIVNVTYHLRPQLTLTEWDQIWEWQTSLPTDDLGMKRFLRQLLQAHDHQYVRNVGGRGRHARLQTFSGGFEKVLVCVLAGARRAGVGLVPREDMRARG